MAHPKNATAAAKRKLFFFNLATLDGFFADSAGGIDWHVADKEFGEFANEQTAAKQVLLFGRVTYQLMASYWPTAAAIKSDPVVARYMNEMPKLVFSRTLKQADWSNTRFVKRDAALEVAALKRQPGNDLIIFASANLAATLTQHGLIDEYRVMVNPLVLGRGRPLFEEVRSRLSLKLLNARVFLSGNVLLTYQPK